MPLRVLIVRFSSIGDIVLTTPVIRAVREQAGAEVHFLTKKKFAATLLHNPYLERLWTIEKDIGEIAAELVAADFTHLIDLHGNLRTLELKARLTTGQLLAGRRPPRSSTFNKLNREKFLLTRFGWNILPDLHIVERYLAAARGLGVVADGRGLDYFIGPDESVDLRSDGLPERYIALVIGAAHATKRLTPEQLTDFCRRVDFPILLLGGPAEAAAGDDIAAAAGPHVTNTCGRYRLGGSADLVRRATLVVTHDTGLMHIAAAFRRPIISVWGNTVPEFGMYPYRTKTERRQEVRGLSCRPCSKIGHQACPRGHFRCMLDQDIGELARSALSELP